MGIQVIYVFTHDSIFVGEDGPTHEPVEQVASLRLIPGMTVIRPADGPEVAAAWAYALRHQDGPDGADPDAPGCPGDRAPGCVSLSRRSTAAPTSSARRRDAIRMSCWWAPALSCSLRWQRARRWKSGASRARGVYAVAGALPAAGCRLSREPHPQSRQRGGHRGGHALWLGRIVGPDALFITQETYGHSAPAGCWPRSWG